MTVATKSGVSKKGSLKPAARAMRSQVEMRDAIEARADGASTSSRRAIAHALGETLASAIAEANEPLAYGRAPSYPVLASADSGMGCSIAKPSTSLPGPGAVGEPEGTGHKSYLMYGLGLYPTICLSLGIWYEQWPRPTLAVERWAQHARIWVYPETKTGTLDCDGLAALLPHCFTRTLARTKIQSPAHGLVPRCPWLEVLMP